MTEHGPEGTRDASLSDAIIALNAQLDLPTVLTRFLDECRAQTGAEFAAINVLDEDGTSVEFHYRGMDSSVWDRLGRAPGSVGILAEIPPSGTLVVEEVTHHPSFQGLPPGHPPLGSFLGTALRVREHVFGYLYLASKAGGFTDHDQTVVQALAAAASVAIDNSTLYRDALQREKWLAASQEITTTLLADPGDEEAIGRIVESAKTLANASAATLVLPGMGDKWVMEFTAGRRAADLLGLVLPEGGRALKAIRSGVGTIADVPPGTIVLEPVRDFGPALYAPMRAENRPIGLLMLWRDRGKPSFVPTDLTTAQLFADQAALALSIAELRHIRNVSALHEDRKRIADDLHDLVSQELFAAAIQLENLSDQAPEGLRDLVEGALAHVARAQRDVRGVMSSLAQQRSDEPLDERIRREVVLAQDALKFAPATEIDDAVLAAVLDPTLGDDVVAVLREGLSNVAQHAHASRAQITVHVANERLEVVIEDDGVGPPAQMDRHSGTSNLAGRALRRAGTFSLVPRDPDKDPPGTVMRWSARIPG